MIMAEGNTSDGLNKLRLVLGDVTNWLGKREFSEREKVGIKYKDEAKRLCVSSPPCTEINSIKGNVISSISKIAIDNWDPNVPYLGSGYIVSKSPFDVETDLISNCSSGQLLKGKNAIIGNSKVLGGNEDCKNLNIGERDAAFESVDDLDVDNHLVDSCCKVGYSEDDAMAIRVKIASQDCSDPKLKDIGVDAAVDSIEFEAYSCGKVDLLKEDMLSGIPKTVIEDISSPTGIVKVSGVEDTRNDCVDAAMGNSRLYNENHDPSMLELDKGEPQLFVNTVDNELGDSFKADTSRTLSEIGGDSLSNGNCGNAEEAKANVECAGSDIIDYQSDVDDHNSDMMILSQSGSVDCTILPESQESSALGVERSTEWNKGDGRFCLSAGIDSIKTCSCSFCTKAAYIWLDLTCQDIKARVSAMKKSQKEASLLAEEICRSNASEKHHTGSVTRVSKLESDLKHQWGFLFQHMANKWEEESNLLEATLLPLSNLKEKCKTDLNAFK